MDLRRKLEPHGPRLIHTLRGRGFWFGAAPVRRRSWADEPGDSTLGVLLVALALVLIGFSGTLYLAARGDLHRQLDDRLNLALDTLEASVDIEPGGLEWEPADRRLALGVDLGEGRSAGWSAMALGGGGPLA